MNENSLIEPSEQTASANKFLPLVLILFFGSGCAALIYEIVWFQLIQLMIGSSSISLGVLLGVYMGGMCLGSLILPRIISAKRHPLRVYALLELGIGILGVAILFAMPYLDKLYLAHVGSGMSGIFFRGVICAICLLPPTLLMGATLPAIARWVETTPRGVSWLGFFYGGNIVGAVFGCLLAGFYLLRIHDMATATYVAASINASVAFIGIVVSFLSEYSVFNKDNTEIESAHLPGTWIVYVAIAISGMSALGAEVTWTRLLSLLLGGTVYTFSIILAVFLFGLGIGSSIGSFISRYTLRPRLMLGLCQLLLTGAIAWTAYMIANSLPYWPIDPYLSGSPWYNFQLDVLRCIWVILPAACLWGASFPLALASVISPGKDPGKIVGGIYAVNTIGAIIGSICFTLFVIPRFGTQQSQRVLVVLAAIAAFLMLKGMLFSGEKKVSSSHGTGMYILRFAVIILFVGALVVIGFLVKSVDKIPWGLISNGRYMATLSNQMVPGITKEEDIPATGSSQDTYCIYAAEGMNVSIAVTETSSGLKCFHGAGKVQASNDPQDMRLQRMLGHISALLNKKPESVLVVACGAGVTAGSFVPHPEVKRIVICDIEPLVPQNVAPRFAKENYDVVNDPRTELVYDDGRHFIHTTKEKFDVITSDPIDPWVKGCAALNTVEYYTMCRDHLNPGGVMALWMPFYESNSQTVKSLISTFFEVFPNGIIWSNDFDGVGYDAVLFGQVGPTQINLDELQERLDREDHFAVKQSMYEVGFNSIVDLLATYGGQATDLHEWRKDAQINTDRNLRLQYLAGMWLNAYQEERNFSEILGYYRFPDELFSGSEENLSALKTALEKSGRRETSNLLSVNN